MDHERGTSDLTATVALDDLRELVKCADLLIVENDGRAAGIFLDTRRLTLGADTLGADNRADVTQPDR